jgi:hypothetical protein
VLLDLALVSSLIGLERSMLENEELGLRLDHAAAATSAARRPGAGAGDGGIRRGFPRRCGAA